MTTESKPKYILQAPYTSPEIKPYTGPDINQKFPGEDDLVWCGRCKDYHRRGPPWEVAEQRFAQTMAEKIAKEIDDEIIEQIKNGSK